MARYCPHIRCFDCNNYGHVTADCPDKIPPSGMPAWHSNNTSSRCDRSASWNGHTRHSHHNHRDRHRFSRSQSHSYNPRHRSNSHSDSCRSCSRSFHQPSCHSSLHHRSSSTYHIADPHHVDIYPEETVDPEHISPAGNVINQHKDHLPVHKQCLGNIRTEGTNRSQLTIFPQNIIAQMNRIVTQRMI